LKVLGTIEFFYKDKFFVVKTIDKKAAFRINYKVYGPDLTVIGKAIDVLGPLNQPRVLVKLTRQQPRLRENTKVFYETEEKRRGGKKRE